MCVELHLRLNRTTRPVANKYREGKMERTLKRKFKCTRNRSGLNLRYTKYRMGRFIVNGVRLPLVRDSPGGPFMVPLAMARHLRIEHSSVVVVHFSPSSTSRPVLCLSTVRVGACRVVSAHPAVPRSSGRLHDGIGQQPIHSHDCVCVHPAASSVSS